MQTQTEMQTQVQPQVQVQPQSQTQIQTYHFDEVVNSEGVVTLSGLPPLAKVAIVVIKPELLDWRAKLELLRRDLQQNHPFAKMSKEEILAQLRKTREEVYDELYGYRHAD